MTPEDLARNLMRSSGARSVRLTIYRSGLVAAFWRQNGRRHSTEGFKLTTALRRANAAAVRWGG